MLRSPRATLAAAIERPQSAGLGALIIAIVVACSVGFLLTKVGRLAALDQEVRQLESFGANVDDRLYGELRAALPYRPALTAATIVIGWPLAWISIAGVLRAWGNRGPIKASFNQVLSVVVCASSVLALRSVVALPINYARESIGGATSVGVLLPGVGDSTFAARLFGAVDIFLVWWVVLVAMGFGMLYKTRTLPVARWLLGAYATGAAALALTQAFRGGV